jgi:hypothetical protein
MTVPPFVVGMLIVGWFTALLFYALWRHAENWKEKWRDEWSEVCGERDTAQRQALDACNQRDEALERVAKFPKLWECPSCGFEMNAAHTDDVPGPEFYTCPACFQARVETVVKRVLRLSHREFKPLTVRPLLRVAIAETKYPKEAA